MIKYRPHRSTLADAMSEYKEFSDIKDMLLFIEQSHKPFLKASDIVITESHGLDNRIGWNSSRYVCTKQLGDEKYDVPQCIGMCDLGELD